MNQKISEEINKPEGTCKKLIKNFDNKKKKIVKKEKLNIYSNTIFENVIKEYNKFIK